MGDQLSSGVLTYADVEREAEALRQREKALKRKDEAIWREINDLRADLYALVRLQRRLRAANGTEQ